MQDAVDAAPLRQHSNERSGGERLSAVRGRQQSNSGPLACGRYQNIEATCREARLDRHGTRVPVLRGQMPGATTLLLLVKDREGGKFSWRRRFTFFCQQRRTRHEEASAYADPLHLKVRVGVETFPNPDRQVYAFMNQIDPPIGYDALEPEQRMGGKEA